MTKQTQHGTRRRGNKQLPNPKDKYEEEEQLRSNTTDAVVLHKKCTIHGVFFQFAIIPPPPSSSSSPSSFFFKETNQSINRYLGEEIESESALPPVTARWASRDDAAAASNAGSGVDGDLGAVLASEASLDTTMAGCAGAATADADAGAAAAASGAACSATGGSDGSAVCVGGAPTASSFWCASCTATAMHSLKAASYCG